MRPIPFARAARLASAFLLTATVVASAQQYRQQYPTQRGPQQAAGHRQTRFPTSVPVGRAPYNYQAHRAVSASQAQGMRQPVAPAYATQPQGEVRGGRAYAQAVAYQQESLPPEVVVQEDGPIVPMPVEGNPTYPVEVIDGNYDGGVVYQGEGEYAYSEEGSCESCGSGDGGICDYVPRCKGCDREKCPCPSDEALSYYRCNFYGHYPTFWRTWPEGFLKYRPQLADTMYDRYRPAPKGMEKSGRDQRDKDLDDQLKELLQEQSKGAPGSGGEPPVPGAPIPRTAPELLPNDPLAPDNTTPGPKDGSSYQPRENRYRQPVQPVGWRR